MILSKFYMRVSLKVIFFLFIIWPVYSYPARPADKFSPDMPDTTCLEDAGACFDLALNRYRQGDYNSRSAFQKLLSVPEYRVRAGLILSRILFEQGDISSVELISDEMGSLEIFEDYRLYYLAGILLKNGRSAEAVEAYGRLLEHPDSVWEKNALLELGRLQYEARKYADARKSFQKLKKKLGRNDELMKEVLFTLAMIAGEEGDFKTEISHLRATWRYYPASLEAKESEVILRRKKGLAFPSNEDILLRASSLHNMKDFPGAIKEYRKVFKPGRYYTSSSFSKMGSAYYSQKQYSEASDVYRKITGSRNAKAGIVEDAYFYLSRIYFNQEDSKGLLRVLTGYKKRFPMGKRLPRALRMAGILYQDKRDNKKTEWFLNKQSLFVKNPEVAQMGLWEMGWYYYKGQKYAAAIGAFHRYIKRFPDGDDYRKVLYWHAKAHEKNGELSKALVAYKDVCSEFTHSFYCHNSLNRTLAIAKRGAAFRKAADEVLSFANPMGNLSENDSGVYSIQPVNKQLLANPNYIRFQLLFDMGLKDSLPAEAKIINKKFGFLRNQVNGILYNAGDYHALYRALGSYFSNVLVKGDERMPESFWKHAYSFGFMDVIDKSLDGKKVDRYFVSSIIREESAYNPEALSSVGAVGLMQLMSYTGEWIAKRLEIDFKEDMLSDAATNIMMGAYYLDYLFEQMDSNMIFTIASYNAGPDKVDEWRKAFRGMEMDEFIQSITYRETRMFVKRVMRSYIEYIRIANKTDSDVLDTIAVVYGRRS